MRQVRSSIVQQALKYGLYLVWEQLTTAELGEGRVDADAELVLGQGTRVIVSSVNGCAHVRGLLQPHP